MFNDEIEKKKLNSIKFTCQTCDTSYEIELTAYKASQNKLWNSISNKQNVKV